MESEVIKNKLFKLVQDYLKSPPLIIWGSGATIPFGMPSMENLKEQLKIQEEGNLEEILSKMTDKKRKKYELKIFEIINRADTKFSKDFSDEKIVSKHLNYLIKHFYEAHPLFLNIITTNYDCILEYVLSFYDFSFSDGFTGREFSKFTERRFKEKEHVNLYKVHGSLRWFSERYSYNNSFMDAIFPSKNKYQEASKEPFRTLIQRSDNAITDASCFLSIGFGFNDEHLTPKIEGPVKFQKNRRHC